MEENMDKVQKIPEEDDNYSEEIPYDTTSWGADLSFRDLISRYKEGELIKPDIQRNYVWKKEEACYFIESVLLGLPIPSIFLSKKKDQYFIIDGFQRLTTVDDFVKGISSIDKKPFKLLNSNSINERWRGKSFEQLTQTEQRRILSTTIHTIIFSYDIPKGKPDTILYQVFKRINESGRTLTSQEIRNCVYQGNFNKMLKMLNKNLDWREIYGEIDTRMRDLELLLRFFALADNKLLSLEKRQISLNKVLNEFLDNHNLDSDSNIKKMEHEFSQVISFIKKNIGVQAFSNYTKDKAGNIKEEFVLSDKIYPTIFDSISIATLFELRENGNKKIEYKNLEKKRLELLKDKDFIEATSIRTTNLENINRRISIAKKYLYENEEH